MPTHRMLCTAEEAAENKCATTFARQILGRKFVYGRPSPWGSRYIRGARFEEDKRDGWVLIIDYQSKNDEEEPAE